MVRESTDKEGGREVVGEPDGRGPRHKGIHPHLADQMIHRPKMDHEERRSPFHKVGERESTRLEEHRDGARSRERKF